MRSIFENINFILFFISFSIFSSCQKEFVEIQEPSTSETIGIKDNVSALILAVTLKDGSFDNIIDQCSAISIKFPYKIQIEDNLTTISTRQDIDNINVSESDDIKIIFPVTITFSDYSEKILNNEDELESIREQFSELIDDEDNECIDFIYPIELAIFNTTYQKLKNIKVEDDKSMFNVFSQISNLIVEIKFPIQLITPEGILIQVNSKYELENVITSSIGKCDENDDFDLDEEDSTDVDGADVQDNSDVPVNDNQSFFTLLTAKQWTVTLFSDTQDETTLFSPYVITFGTDSTMTIKEKAGSKTFSGSWILENSDDGKNILEIDIKTDDSPLTGLNEEWEIVGSTVNTIELQTESDTEGFIKKLKLSVSE